jgi:hypothetical protein
MNNSTRKCKKDYCEKVFVKNAQKFFNRFSKTLKMKPMKFTEKQKKEYRKNCLKLYCNPTCKGTVFQDGKEFPKNIEINSKDKKVRKLATQLLKGIRKEIFGKKNSVLKDDFYEKLNSKTVKDLKKKGALSGCAVMVLK